MQVMNAGLTPCCWLRLWEAGDSSLLLSAGSSGWWLARHAVSCLGLPETCDDHLDTSQDTDTSPWY